MICRFRELTINEEAQCIVVPVERPMHTVGVHGTFDRHNNALHSDEEWTSVDSSPEAPPREGV